MFHTFETVKHSPGEHSSASGPSRKNRRTSTIRACEPCRRRKIRCNGEHPCETCQWYRKAETCHYTEPRQRQVPYQRSIEKISATLQDYRAVLQKLFPHVHPDTLLNVPRERLLELINHTSPSHGQSLSPPISQVVEAKPSPPNPEAGSLEALQTMPEEASDTSDTDRKGVPGISDDINALSLSVKPSSSYLGISSVMAILRVIIWLDPDAQSVLKSPDRSSSASRDPSLPPEALDTGQNLQSNVSSVWDEIPLINAYFVYVHAFVPLIEERSFRETYTSGRRNDSRWLALLNVVLAMGSMAASTSDDKGHRVYYNRAMQHIDFDALGSAHLETVQTFALLGGFYLHYIQEPTLASALMGATLRLAVTLGLHREYLDGRTQQDAKKGGMSVEMRRRIWWCVFILDAWASANLGRPTMGRWGHAITAKPPQYVDQQQAGPTLLLQESVRFSIISTRIEDALAVSPLIPTDELLALDDSMVNWYRNLPSLLQASQNTPQQHAYEMPGITIAKSVMRWRYHLTRLSIHRPVLLWYALRRMPYSDVSAEKQVAIDKCRDAAAELIADIASNWKGAKPCQMSGWNACWLLYQASLVPLLSLFSDATDGEVVESCQQQVEMVMGALDDMNGWSLTAERTLEVVSKIYEASKRFMVRSLQKQQQDDSSAAHRFYDPVHPSRIGIPESTGFNANTMDSDVMMDSMWDSLNWSTGWENVGFPFETPTTSPDWEFGPASAWSEQPGSAAFPFKFETIMEGTQVQMPTPSSIGNQGQMPTPSSIGNPGQVPTPNSMGRQQMPTPSSISRHNSGYQQN